ncbi:phage portal protein [Xanthomonas sacchari]|uniref:phage portal protein n=1 Tax=Xanthomonas sacchari TaxID=56458 RepID=UPI00225AE50A|nr:phage portal protein [Xanthomonas sacchari]UYK72528.1 phage portal protein [Xanthomonas sacchari]
MASKVVVAMAAEPARAAKGDGVRANLLDRGFAVFAPRYAARRMFARSVLSLYEGGRSTKRRRKSRENGTSERLVSRDAATVRATIRDLERNYDLVDGALSTLVRNIIGPSGISIEPTPRLSSAGAAYDSIDDDFARELLSLWRDWCVRPEVTRTLNWVQAQELACRSWLRDGEVFAQIVEGTGAPIIHASRVPLSIELLEADVVPLDHDDEASRVQAGIERNTWGQPLAYWMFKEHPGNGGWSGGQLKRVPAQQLLHVAVRKRLSGLRGISLFASAIDRLIDIKDYEESERTAARIAARIAAYIKRDVNMESFTPNVGENGQPAERDFLLEAGALFTDTLPGESIEMVDPKRPNTILEKFRMAMMRAVSRAIGLSYSSLSGDYDGTYSAQRQELVEAYDGYRMMTQQFVSGFIQPIWERFVQMAVASGQIKVPAHIRRETVAQASFRGPKMPWIDPLKEANAIRTLARGGVQSVTQSIAERGGRVQDVFEEFARERHLAAELGIRFDTDIDNDNPAPSAAAADAGASELATDANSRQRAARVRLVGTGDSV